MSFTVNAFPILQNQTVAHNFGVDGSNALLIELPGAAASSDVPKHLEALFEVLEKTGAGEVRARVVQVTKSLVTDGDVISPVQTSISNSYGSTGQFTVNLGASTTKSPLPVGAVVSDAVVSEMVTGNKFLLKTAYPVLGATYIYLTASDAATARFTINAFVEEQLNYR
jgi:hypothetical protein